MEYMSEYERAWAKENGLKRTNLKVFEYGKHRVVFRAKDGRLYFRFKNVYHGTFPDCCTDFGDN